MKNSVEHKESEQEGERVREVQLSEHQNRADDQQWLPESVQTGRRWGAWPDRPKAGPGRPGAGPGRSGAGPDRSGRGETSWNRQRGRTQAQTRSEPGRCWWGSR